MVAPAARAGACTAFIKAIRDRASATDGHYADSSASPGNERGNGIVIQNDRLARGEILKSRPHSLLVDGAVNAGQPCTDAENIFHRESRFLEDLIEALLEIGTSRTHANILVIARPDFNPCQFF